MKELNVEEDDLKSVQADSIGNFKLLNSFEIIGRVATGNIY